MQVKPGGRRLLFVIPNLRTGGAQRAIVVLANAHARSGDDVTLLAFAGGQRSAAFAIDPQVKLVEYETVRPAGKIGRIVCGALRPLAWLSRIRREARRAEPDIVISFLERTNIFTLVALAGRPTPVVICERTDPNARNIGFINTRLRRLTYPFADALVTQSKEAMAYFAAFPLRRRFVVSNAIDRSRFDAAGEVVRPPRPTVIAVGGLRHVKGFDLLLAAFRHVVDVYPDWQLVIWGEGPDRASLWELTSQLRLTNHIAFPGETSDVFSEFRKADLFVMPSRAEGFPNALLEAMACGLPCVAFDCPSGPRQLIRSGRNGVLVPAEDVTALAQAMTTLMADPALRQRLGTAAREVLQDYSEEAILAQWRSLYAAILDSAASQPCAEAV